MVQLCILQEQQIGKFRSIRPISGRKGPEQEDMPLQAFWSMEERSQAVSKNPEPLNFNSMVLF